ncbi:PPOX class F420-dependent oxidoreductase [Amycolatopsis acidiphila]|uniref:PPOX class F420-dependent oxidoreductase n=1 Tax=Amycolatopsis acidiphila TaxID=715473 RepID=A0A558ADE5_9PSEU|nr:PPOX class F420-dependent oxidoreductase [Amycolatopsis acidiphila]TVT22280.1 PPOX class F420-dependent oxidoreductase [Amycolatopsis acidiphila]UIJ58004.1 PPOX class F420-dependent oxidoreductase [Amycolatopsis acidiphila]GHG70615.1 PPOX class F420-dependent oxidoreductase [Amycolatopsis acidiphila]
MFTDAEIDYLNDQGLGRLATLHPNGSLQVSPVGFSYNPDEKAIEVRGYHLTGSRKFRNIAANGKVAFVVDDRPSLEPMRVRCLEIRGRAEALTGAATPDGHLDDAVIRIHPERIISFGIEDPDRPPLEQVPHNRNV